MSRKWEPRPDGTRYGTNVRPSRRTVVRKEKRIAALAARDLRKNREKP